MVFNLILGIIGMQLVEFITIKVNKINKRLLNGANLNRMKKYIIFNCFSVSMSQVLTQKQTSAISTKKRQVGVLFSILHH